MSAAFRNIIETIHLLASMENPVTSAGKTLSYQLANLDGLNHARETWYTERKSKEIFDWVQRAQLVADFYGAVEPPVGLPNTPFSPEVWRELEERAEAMTSGFVSGDYLLDRIDTWLLEAYALPGLCEASPGDTVLDCGTYTGNTSMYFSQKVGPDGHVYGFEAAPPTFAAYAENMRPFANVTPVNAAVYDSCGSIMFKGESPGAQIASEGTPMPSVSLDAFCEENKLDRVDFIKMDVEGAEIKALTGARGIIQRFTPKMALSAYHEPDDIVKLPAFVDSIAPGRYFFRLRHFSNCIFETVLYCIPGTDPVAAAAPRSSAYGSRMGEKECATALLALYFCMFKSISFLVQTMEEIQNSQPLQSVTEDIIKTSEQFAAQFKEQLQETENLQKENLILRSLLEKARAGK